MPYERAELESQAHALLKEVEKAIRSRKGWGNYIYSEVKLHLRELLNNIGE